MKQKNNVRIKDGEKQQEVYVVTRDRRRTSEWNFTTEADAKLEAQHGILIALIDRVRSVDNEIIRQDTLLKTMLGVPNLVQNDKIAKAERDDQRKD